MPRSFGADSIATESVVNKLEVAYKTRVLHIRTVMHYLGKEAEADVLTLFISIQALSVMATSQKAERF